MPSSRCRGFGVDSDTLFARFIHQIEAEYGVRHDLEYLQDQNQIAFRQVASATRMAASASPEARKSQATRSSEERARRE